ncbi:CPBP family intramembrane glutamic endopeptidase [Pseudobacteroides cellulosolvens]|uniref:Abortive infection protein n=1 Tax=Pseudobacteroides cellulosolvens ATCC 35603 = DSM 2933 TaxID=398512 RepID=A0A0L6JGH3_9FIRM|nr:type II CAAX endopeptidase family protein [Pseudobacteroides cellulosolvens]KNY24804.1 Abortive infection protein [Pseudobacteroides cellulosolvens ATCC 35603 = DSM 2933]
MKNKITVTGANITFFSFTMAYILFSVVAVLFETIFGGNSLNANFILITLVTQYVVILGPVFVYMLIGGINIKDVFRLNSPGLAPMVIILFAAIPASFVGNALNMLIIYPLSLIGKLPETPIPVPQNLTDVLLMIFVIAVTPGICEEILNRGVILKAYEKRGTYKAIVISGILFGIFHFDMQNLLGPIFLGILFSYYVIRTNSIFSSMFAHFLNNTYAVVIMYLARNQEISGGSQITFQQFGFSMLQGMIAFALLVVLLLIFTKITDNKSRLIPPISNAKRDFISIISHWPIIVILSVYIFINGLLLLTILASNLG